MIIYYWKDIKLFFFDFKRQSEVGLYMDGTADYSFYDYTLNHFETMDKKIVNIIYDGRKKNEKKT